MVIEARGESGPPSNILNALGYARYWYDRAYVIVFPTATSARPRLLRRGTVLTAPESLGRHVPTNHGLLPFEADMHRMFIMGALKYVAWPLPTSIAGEQSPVRKDITCHCGGVGSSTRTGR
jgi:hypothetical protein